MSEAEGMLQHVAARPGGWVVGGVAVVLLAGLAGCTRSATESLLPVEGRVQYEGKPLTKGVVILYPDKDKGNTSEHEPRGNIEADGRYKISTHPRLGATAGWYKVAVNASEPSDPKQPYSLPRSLIREKFGNKDESGLTLEVRSGAPPGTYDLELK
jgi:hypothetical protein